MAMLQNTCQRNTHFINDYLSHGFDIKNKIFTKY